MLYLLIPWKRNILKDWLPLVDVTNKWTIVYQASDINEYPEMHKYWSSSSDSDKLEKWNVSELFNKFVQKKDWYWNDWTFQRRSEVADNLWIKDYDGSQAKNAELYDVTMDIIKTFYENREGENQQWDWGNRDWWEIQFLFDSPSAYKFRKRTVNIDESWLKW